MGCGCFTKVLDTDAPNHKPYKTPPGGRKTGGASSTVAGDARDFPQPRARERISGAYTNASPAVVSPVDAVCTGPSANVGGSPKGSRRKGAWSVATILAEGSVVQGLWLPPWDEADEDVANNFGYTRGGSSSSTALPGSPGQYDDRDGLLELSERQREALHAWKRLPEVIRAARGSPSPAVLATSMTSRSIKQGLVGDCSFLSALSALAEYETKFKEPVLSSIIHPRGEVHGRIGPVFNEYGQYGCRLFLNGTERKVIVDDRVPVRGNGQLLCAHSADVKEIWVTLLEKSFAKIMGSSYDMQGSNPGTDVFHLTGWVPETIPLGGGAVVSTVAGKGDVAPIAEAPESWAPAGWDEVYNATAQGYSNGHCVVCVGTSELADAAPDVEARRLGHIEGVSTSTGLVARHAYPVLGCRRLGRHRLLRLKNPWGRVRWRGRFSPGDRAWREAAKEASSCDGFGPDDLAANATAAGGVDDGHFWIEWEDVLRYFSHLYLCWAPRSMGLRRLEAHGRWDPEPHFTQSSLADDTHIVSFNPQFLLRLDAPVTASSSDGAAVDDVVAWVLLSRHVRVRAEISSKYVAAHVYRSNGTRLCCPDAPLEQGVYSNGECALVKLRRAQAAKDGGREFVIVISQHNAKTVFNFTLQVYTSIPGTLTPLPPLVPDSYISGAETGQWTQETAGGCSNNLWQYFQNPQWRLEVPPGDPVTLIIFVECPEEHSVNVRLFRGVAARPEELRRAVSSGAYRQGCCVLRVSDLPPGPHVAVVSTFRPGLCGDYRLAWHCSQSIKLRPQPHPFAVSLPPPLKTAVHQVPQGRLLRLWLHNKSATATACDKVQIPTLLSARLQLGARKIGTALPSLGLLQELGPPGGQVLHNGAKVKLEPARCELQKESYAESYFSFAAAAVMLVAELAPGERRVLEALLPAASVPDRGSGGALYVSHAGPLSVEVDDSCMGAPG